MRTFIQFCELYLTKGLLPFIFLLKSFLPSLEGQTFFPFNLLHKIFLFSTPERSPLALWVMTLYLLRQNYDISKEWTTYLCWKQMADLFVVAFFKSCSFCCCRDLSFRQVTSNAFANFSSQIFAELIRILPDHQQLVSEIPKTNFLIQKYFSKEFLKYVLIICRRLMLLLLLPIHSRAESFPCQKNKSRRKNTSFEYKSKIFHDWEAMRDWESRTVKMKFAWKVEPKNIFVRSNQDENCLEKHEKYLRNESERISRTKSFINICSLLELLVCLPTIGYSLQC